MTSEKEICVTSFCINCGEVVRYECCVDDPRLNNEPCTTCLPLLAKVLESEMAEDFVVEANTAVDDMLPPQVKRAKRTAKKIEIEAAQKSGKLARQQLRERRATVHSERYMFPIKN